MGKPSHGVHEYRTENWQHRDSCCRMIYLIKYASFIVGALQQEEWIAPPDAILQRLRLWGDRTIAQDGIGTNGTPRLQHGTVGNEGARLESDAPEARTCC